MPLHGKLLDAADAVGPGVTFQFDTPKEKASAQVIVTGEPTEAEVNLEYSLDGEHWKSVQIFLASLSPDGQYGGAGVPAVFTHVRANLVTLTGGTDPTVTVWFAAI